MKIVVVGGGPAGFSAAVVAKRAGASVTLIERTDTLGGAALSAGMVGYSSGAVAEEQALGGGDLYKIFDSIATHKRVAVPGLGVMCLYNVTKLDSWMQRALKESEVEFMLCKRVIDIEISGDRVEAVKLAGGTRIEGDVFIDATGGAFGGTGACAKWGRGCVCCIYRCPAFGPVGGMIEKRVKIVSAQTQYGKPGLMAVAVMVPMASLSEELQKEFSEKGYVFIPVPPDAKPDLDRLKRVGLPPRVDTDALRRNLFLVDIGGFAKVVGAGSAMYAGSLRSFPGLKDAMVMEPLAGARGHGVGWTAMAPRDNSLKIDGFHNLFCAGPKAGPMGSLVDAVATGDLAGYNAVRKGVKLSCLELPKTLAAGAFIEHTGQATKSENILKTIDTLTDIQLLKTLKVFREDEGEIAKVVEKTGLRGIYKTKLCSGGTK